MKDQLQRVALNLSETIIEFWRLRLAAAQATGMESRFTSLELRHYVNAKNFGTAPSSADRIMRSLRSQGKINYVLTNRAKSLYTAVPLVVKVG
jgi:hypothetical protein